MNGTAELRRAVEAQHGGSASFVESVAVKEVFEGKTVWDGTVAVFDLAGSANATRAYAWSSPIEGSTRRRYYAVLHLGGIKSARDAVKAAIVADHRAKRG